MTFCRSCNGESFCAWCADTPSCLHQSESCRPINWKLITTVVVVIMCLMVVVILGLIVCLYRRRKERKQQKIQTSNVKETSFYEDAYSKGDEAESKPPTTPTIDLGPHEGESNTEKSVAGEDKNAVSIPVDVVTRVMVENIMKERGIHSPVESLDHSHSDASTSSPCDRCSPYPRCHCQHDFGSHCHRQPYPQFISAEELSRIQAVIEYFRAEGIKAHSDDSSNHRSSPYTPLNPPPVPNGFRSQGIHADIHHPDPHHSPPVSNNVRSDTLNSHRPQPVSNNVQSDTLNSHHSPPVPNNVRSDTLNLHHSPPVPNNVRSDTLNLHHSPPVPNNVRSDTLNLHHSPPVPNNVRSDTLNLHHSPPVPNDVRSDNLNSDLCRTQDHDPELQEAKSHRPPRLTIPQQRSSWSPYDHPDSDWSKDKK